ncbi:MAG: hypothetical protein WC860_01125, partial [Candidatus Margulisiibacteriota bacterium]
MCKFNFFLIFFFITFYLFTQSAQASSQKKHKPYLYGHSWYQEASIKDLSIIEYYHKTKHIVLLKHEAAAAFREMALEASKNNVILIPISGFRSINKQKT